MSPSSRAKSVPAEAAQTASPSGAPAFRLGGSLKGQPSLEP